MAKIIIFDQVTIGILAIILFLGIYLLLHLICKRILVGIDFYEYTLIVINGYALIAGFFLIYFGCSIELTKKIDINTIRIIVASFGFMLIYLTFNQMIELFKKICNRNK